MLLGCVVAAKASHYRGAEELHAAPELLVADLWSKLNSN